MFKLIFHNSCSKVDWISLDDGSFSQPQITRLKPALEQLLIENPCLTFARKNNAGGFDSFDPELINDIAFVSDAILADCWQYAGAPALPDGKPDIRPYMGVINLIEGLLNYALQAYRRILELEDKLDELKHSYEEICSNPFEEC